MTEEHALLASVISNPNDDLPRLILADWWEENGQPERAEFCRVQVELSEWDRTIDAVPAGRRSKDGSEIRKASARGVGLRRRERELLDANAHTWLFALPPGTRPILPDAIRNTFSRGFIASLALDWQMWLRHADSLFWSPGQTEPCQMGMCKGWMPGENPWVHCKSCGGTGRIRRPFVPTAQPLTEVRLTDWPNDGLEGRDIRLTDVFRAGKYRFDRMKCPTCDGRGHNWPIHGDWTRCPECTGRAPLNEWRCEAWPTLVFVMPEAERRPYGGLSPTHTAVDEAHRMDAAERAYHYDDVPPVIR